MPSTVRDFRRCVGCLCGLVLVIMVGCGGGGNSIITKLPISVSLPVSTVVVMQGGEQVTVQILINSTSETALVSFRGLPSGVQVKYSASDTNPSGLLAFTGNSLAMPGSYPITITVNSAQQTASTTFTLVVTESASGNL